MPPPPSVPPKAQSRSHRPPVTQLGGGKKKAGQPSGKKRPPRTTPKKWLVSDTQSQNSAGDSISNATPTSVNIGSASVLTRDLSDLSGSYLNGTTVRNAQLEPPTVYQSDQSATSYQRPWRLAKILSSREPSHPQPPQDCNDSVGMFKEKLLVGPQGLVEVVPHCGSSVGTSDSSRNNEARLPICVLLMDPGRKIYELMQLWIDLESDSVRDVLHAVQLALSNRWRQDYDGLFSTRNHTFSQLIHILDVAKYDVQPLELWVAKPWAMPAKATVNYASRCVQHLQQLGIITQLCSSSHEPGGRSLPLTPSRRSSPACAGEEIILVLSKEAQTRSYVPGGVMKHYHAYQFLSFSPAFESSTQQQLVRVDVLAAETPDEVASQLSDSQLGTSILMSDYSCDEGEDPYAAVHVTPHDTSVLNSGTEVVRMRLAKYPVADSNKVSKSPTQQQHKHLLSQRGMPAVSQESALPVQYPLSRTEPPVKSSSFLDCHNSLEKDDDYDDVDYDLPRGGLGQLLCLLNCRRSSARAVAGSRRLGNNSTDPMSTASPLSTMETMREESGPGQLWKVWEDDAASKCSTHNSDSRPLLRQHVQTSRTDRSDWL